MNRHSNVRIHFHFDSTRGIASMSRRIRMCVSLQSSTRVGAARRCIRPHGCTHVRTIIMTLRVYTQLPFPVRKAEDANRKCESSYDPIFIELCLIINVIHLLIWEKRKKYIYTRELFYIYYNYYYFVL